MSEGGRSSRLTLALVPDLFLAAAWAAILSAAALSAVHRLNSRTWWIATFAMVAALLVAARWRLRPRLPVAEAAPQPADSFASCALLAGCAAATVVSIAANVLLAVGAAPGSWDALSYHLPRAALSLQSGAFYYGDVNYWAQTAHPIFSTALLFLPAVVTGASEHAWPAWQMTAAMVAPVVVFLLARMTGGSRSGSAFAAFTFALLPPAILQAPIATNDLLLAAATGVGALAIARWTTTADDRWLVMFAAAIGCGLGMKATFVAQAAMLVVLALAAQRRFGARTLGRFATAVLAGVALALPAGYVQNARRYGNPLGPAEATAHAAAGSIGDRAIDGALNTGRLATDFLSLDGLPPAGPFRSAQRLLRRGVAVAWTTAVPARFDGRARRTPFLLDRPMLAAEAHAYWGVTGLLLIWPAVLWTLVRGARLPRALAVAAIAFVVLEGFSGPYDVWRGRYFLSSAVVAAPLVAAIWDSRRRYAPAVRAVAVVMVCATGLYTAFFRSGAQLIPVTYEGVRHAAIWSEDRAAQLCRQRPAMADAVRRYEALVPPDARVASALAPDSYEYALFGPRLTRTVVPLGSRPPSTLPQLDADYLVFSSTRISPDVHDEHLGEDWWLRRLKLMVPRHQQD